jgi:hypothetical protein
MRLIQFNGSVKRHAIGSDRRNAVTKPRGFPSFVTGILDTTTQTIGARVGRAPGKPALLDHCLIDKVA